MTRDYIRRLAAAGTLVIGLLAATVGPAMAGTRDPLEIGPDGFDPFSFPIPTSYSYNQVPLGSAPRLTFTVYDLTGAQAQITTSLTGSAEFTRLGPTDPYDCARFSILPADQFCDITVQFAPTTLGTVTGQLTVQDSAGNTASVTLSGTGVAHLYWTDVVDGSAAGAGTIMGPLLDGGNPRTLATGQSAPAGIATDGSHLYWADDSGTIMEAGLDGSNPLVIATGQSQPWGVAVTSSHLYWTNQGNGTAGSGTIMEAGLDGSNPHAIVTGQTYPTGLAADSNHLYWADYGPGTIMEASLDGSNAHSLITGQSTPSGIAVNGGHIYWTEPYYGKVMAANLDGTGAQTLLSGQASPDGLAVDSHHIYWISRSDASRDPDSGAVMAANLDGTGAQTLIAGQPLPWGLATW